MVKNPPCNAGDPGSIPGLGRSAGEGKKLPTPIFWPGELHGLYSPWAHRELDRMEQLSLSFSASFVAQLVKNPPAMWEAWVRSLGWEDPLERGKATHSSILGWRIPWTV